jgi:HEAT repeat protein
MVRTTLRAAYLGLVGLLLAGGASAFGQDARPATSSREAKLIAVLKSDAPRKDKADACRELARVGTKDCIAPLVALLGDETMSHMARYALEPIPDPAVDSALREAAGRLKGRPLIGVIGSIGVRRDAKAVDRLAALLKDKDADVARAAARSLGSVGNLDASKVLEDALGRAPAEERVAIADGLFRCAEALSAGDRRGEAIAIYERLDHANMPKPVRDAAARKARFLGQESGQTL